MDISYWYVIRAAWVDDEKNYKIIFENLKYICKLPILLL